MSVPTPAGDRPAYPIGSVDSALKLLMMLSEHSHVRIAEAAGELGVARSTAHRLMQMLVFHGLARQDPESRAYVAGPRLVGLGLQLVRKLDVRNIAHPYMEELAAQVRETVHLQALQTEGTVICLESVESPQALRVGSRVGIVFAASASAGGRAILSTLAEDDLLAMYPSDALPEHSHSPLTHRQELLERLAVVRDCGYAVQRDESEAGVSAISAPIRLDDQSASFALTVALPSSRLDDRVAANIGRDVLAAAGRLAAALGL